MSDPVCDPCRAGNHVGCLSMFTDWRGRSYVIHYCQCEECQK